MNAAQAKDYVETISGLDKGLPNVDTLFWRLSECASRDLILREYKKVVKRHFEAAKGADKKKAIYYICLFPYTAAAASPQ